MVFLKIKFFVICLNNDWWNQPTCTVALAIQAKPTKIFSFRFRLLLTALRLVIAARNTAHSTRIPPPIRTSFPGNSAICNNTKFVTKHNTKLTKMLKISVVRRIAWLTVTFYKTKEQVFCGSYNIIPTMIHCNVFDMFVRLVSEKNIQKKH